MSDNSITMFGCGVITALVALFILQILITAIYKKSSKYLVDKIVTLLNSLPIRFQGTTLTQSLDNARKKGGRLSYYIYPNPRVFSGANLIPFAISLNSSGMIDDFYFGASIKKKNTKKYSNIGGYFDSFSNAPYEVPDFHSREASITTDTRKIYNKEFIKRIINNNMLVYSSAQHYDRHPLDNVIREIKEETGWLLKADDMVSLRPYVVTECKERYTSNLFLLHTNYFISFFGELGAGGDIYDKNKNIIINNYTCKGYDDIEKIDFFSLSSITMCENHYEIGTDKIMLSKNKMHSVYIPSIIEAVNYIAKTYYRISLRQLSYNKNYKDTIEFFQKNCLNIENNRYLYKIMHQNKNDLT